MFRATNVNTGEIKYFTDIKTIAKHLDVTYQAVYFATKGVIKNLRGFNIFKVDNGHSKEAESFKVSGSVRSSLKISLKHLFFVFSAIKFNFKSFGFMFNL